MSQVTEPFEVVVTSNVRIRDRPTLSGKQIGVVAPASRFEVVPELLVRADGWVWRRLVGVRDAWIAERAISSTGPILCKRIVQILDRWDSPVGTLVQRNGNVVWPSGWVDATGYNRRYLNQGRWARHTGADLNNNEGRFDADYLAPCYAPFEGVVVHAKSFSVWGNVVIIDHVLSDRSHVWSRLAHLEDFVVIPKMRVLRGTLLGRIGNANGRFPSHLHYDIAKRDLEQFPTDWPGDDSARVLSSYFDPLMFTRARHESA